MSMRTLNAEARPCHKLAQASVGPEEHDFLLKLAEGFEQLAQKQMKLPVGSRHIY